MKKIILMGLCVLFVAGTALAHWDEGDGYKMHYPQLPDLSPTGMDVNVRDGLADDFSCTDAGPIRDIHIWGSFVDDAPPSGGPGSLTFYLTIYSYRAPGEDGIGWSHPGAVLWSQQFDPGEYTFREVPAGPEDWYDPIPDEWFDDNHIRAFQYNFYIEDKPFEQEEGTVYFLGVEVFPDPNYIFGWKTSLTHWNDDAVYLLLGWVPLTYPAGHEYEFRTIDLAFVITGKEQPEGLDFGDAPDPNFPSFLASSGPRHLNLNDCYVGPLPNTVSAEPDALVPDMDADDGNPLIFASKAPDGTWTAWVYVPISIDIAAGAPKRDRYLNVLLDGDSSGDWCNQPGEWVVRNYPLWYWPTIYYCVGGFSWVGDYSGLHWLRVTVSEQKITANVLNGWDGRVPGPFQYGETEDWLLQWYYDEYDENGQPGEPPPPNSGRPPLPQPIPPCNKTGTIHQDPPPTHYGHSGTFDIVIKNTGSHPIHIEQGPYPTDLHGDPIEIDLPDKSCTWIQPGQDLRVPGSWEFQGDPPNKAWCDWGASGDPCGVTVEIDNVGNYRSPTDEQTTGGSFEEKLSREFGDAPENGVAYPSTGVNGAFPTCMTCGPSGWIQHNSFGAYFGPTFDFETDGDAGLCPPPGAFPPYDVDECFMDGDAGLIIPEPYTIDATGIVVHCPNSMGTPLGTVCRTAVWGANVDIDVHNHMPSQTTGYVNVLMDWNQDGQWAGASNCAVAAAPEHVLVNFMIPPKYNGPLSALMPPNFLIGPKAGYVWTRFTITEREIMDPNWNGEGAFEDGETEDYLLYVEKEPETPPPCLCDPQVLVYKTSMKGKIDDFNEVTCGYEKLNIRGYLVVLVDCEELADANCGEEVRAYAYHVIYGNGSDTYRFIYGNGKAKYQCVFPAYMSFYPMGDQFAVHYEDYCWFGNAVMNGKVKRTTICKARRGVVYQCYCDIAKTLEGCIKFWDEDCEIGGWAQMKARLDKKLTQRANCDGPPCEEIIDDIIDYLKERKGYKREDCCCGID